MAAKTTFKRDPKTGVVYAYRDGKKVGKVGGMGDGAALPKSKRVKRPMNKK